MDKIKLNISEIQKYSELIFIKKKTIVNSFFNKKLNKDIFIKELYKEVSSDHGYEHIVEVIKNGETLLNRELNLNEFLALVFHDIGNIYSRESHEEIGAISCKLLLSNFLTKEDIENISQSIRKHRGSYTGNFQNELEELVSSADRGRPQALDKHIRRSYNFAINKKGISHEDAIYHALIHIKNKYGENGYAKFPNLYLNFYKNELISFQKDIANLTLDDVKLIINKN